MVQRARRQQEREQSEAVRLARKKLLDQEVTEDWKFQVLHKNRIQTSKEQEELARMRDERKLLLQSREQQKQSDFEKLQESIKERIQQEKYREHLRTQEKIEIENKHIEENKESYRIRREIDAEEKEKDKERKETSETLKNELLRQIGRNKSRKEKISNEKRELECLERKRLDHLLQAENIQRKFETKMSNNEKSDFSEATNNFRKVRNQLDKDNDFFFLEEGWRQEKEKIEDKLNLNKKRKEINVNCSNLNKEMMTNVEIARGQHEAEKVKEVERRLDWEAAYRRELEDDKSRRLSEQAQYHRQITDQRAHNTQFRNRDNEYNEILCEHVRKYQKYLQEIDDREGRDPLDRVHSLRK